MVELACGLAHLHKVVDEIFMQLPDGGVIVLRGDLASGKTTLTQYAAKRLGVRANVTSPTFSIQQRYGDELYHYDVYNKGVDHFLSLGLFEALENPGYHFIEWGDERLITLLDQAKLPYVVVDIDKEDKDKDKRRYVIRQGETDA